MISRRTHFRPLLLALALAWLCGTRYATAQQVEREETAVRITAIDTSAFPTVRVRLLLTGAGGARVTDLSRLGLRENGLPVPEATPGETPVGIDLAFVIDANADFLQADELGGVTRRDKVAASLERFAAGNMDPSGLDRVSVVVPDEARQSAVFLVEDASQPAELSSAVAAYAPTGPADQPRRATPLQTMLAAALDHLTARADDGRFQAVLLYTDGARLNQQLDYPALVEAAQAAGIPIYVAVLGLDVSPEEQSNVSRLTDPTNGRSVPMPQPESADPLYALFAAHHNQTELVYASPVRQNGTQQVAVNLGNARATGTYELSLAPPEVVLDVPRTQVRRAGSAVDTPLPLLQPAVLPLTARVVWPDGGARRLAQVRFLVDGVEQPLGTLPQPDASGRLPLAWDISERDAGNYLLSVEVTDELGFRAAAEPVAVTIEIARPQPPTPTPAPTAAPEVAPPPGAPAALLLPLLLLAAAGGALVWATRRARRPKPAPTPAAADALPPPAWGEDHVPVLEWASPAGRVEQIELLADNVTFGRDPDAVDVVLEDPSVSRLHARLRRNADGEYWLYDEGSATGTFLNYERLGLAARQVRHGDSVQMGRVALSFRLELPRPPGKNGLPNPPNGDGAEQVGRPEAAATEPASADVGDGAGESADGPHGGEETPSAASPAPEMPPEQGDEGDSASRADTEPDPPVTADESGADVAEASSRQDNDDRAGDGETPASEEEA